MENNDTHWGEMPERQGFSSEFVSSDQVNLLILKAMKADPLKVYQPCEQEELGLYEVPPECCAMDSTVLHTIQLCQHYKSVQELIRMANPQVEPGSIVQNEIEFEVPKTLPPVPAIPEEPERVQTHGFSYPFRYMEKDFSCFSQGQGITPPRLNAAIAKTILRKSVATILAHMGFDTTSYYILDTLTDIAEEYIQKFTQLLRVTIDQEAMTESTGFADAMERVFHDMGEGSMITLHEFYQSRVLKYHQRMIAACNILHDEYTSLSLPVLRPVSESEIIRCSTSEIDNEEDIPEIHFPALGEGYSADELQPSLEPGFQMLHSLEQEEQLQNLETEEEINVSDSPNQDLTLQGTSMDSQQTPNPNKSRKKKKKMNEGNIGI